MPPLCFVGLQVGMLVQRLYSLYAGAVRGVGQFVLGVPRQVTCGRGRYGVWLVAVLWSMIL